MTALTSPARLWLKLQTDAGLELRRKNAPGRDADLEIAVKDALGLGAVAGSLQDWLTADAASASPRMTIERLLVALLTAQQGYASMMRDMLELLESAQARRDADTIGIQFKFDEVDDPLRFTLEAFRESVLRIERVLVSRPELPDASLLWGIREVLLPWIGQPNIVPLSTFPPAMPIPKTGHQLLDEAISTVQALIAQFRTWCVSYGPTRRDAFNAALVRHPDSAGPGGRELVRRVGAGTDYWDLTVESQLGQIAHAVNVGAMDPDQVLSTLTPQLAQLSFGTYWAQRSYTELLDLLNLPTWRKRYELFSVWAGGVLLRVARDHADKFQFLTEDGVLSFAFGGSRLATYTLAGEQRDIWAELRSALLFRSAKRKKGIQPDFRVLRPSLVKSHNAQTVFVLECKHYLTPSVSNFAQAAKDYATSCPDANVVIANHGPLDETSIQGAVMAAIERSAGSVDGSVDGSGDGSTDGPVAPTDKAAIDSLALRTRFLGNVTPDTERASGPLRALIREMLFPASAKDPAAGAGGSPHSRATQALPPGVVAAIELIWNDTLEDVDLALTLDEDQPHSRQVDYRARGDLHHEPFALLEQDQRHGPGSERIDISSWHYARYRITARNFSDRGRLSPGHVRCLIQIGDRVWEEEPGLNTDDEWLVGSIDVERGEPRWWPGSAAASKD